MHINVFEKLVLMIRKGWDMKVGKPEKKGYAKWLFVNIRRRIPSLVILAVLSVLGSYLGVVFALVIQDVIDSAVSGNTSIWLRTCMILGCIILIRLFCTAMSLHLREKITAYLDRDLKKNMMHKILHSDYSAISAYHSGDLVNRMNGDVSSLHNSIIVIVSSATSLITGLLTAVVVLMQMAPAFTAAIGTISVVLALVTLLIQQHMKELHKKASSENGKVTGFFQEIIGKLLIVQALDVSEEIERRAEDLLETRWQILRRRKNVSISISVGSSSLSFIGSFITLIWCSLKLLNNEITFGELTAMTTLVSQLQTPMLMLPAIIPKFTAVSAACERLMEIENIPEQPSVLDRKTEELYGEMYGITAEHLTFAYDRDRDPVMRNVDFMLPKGGLTVIVGASGIGKSTLLKLLLGIYKPTSGMLTLNTKSGDIPVSRATRSLFSYAPQGNLLLSGTLRENLLLAKTDASEAEIEEAIYVSAMDEYISDLPNGLDTYLGENAAGLSEGQAQRLSLARAVLSGAPILLLDEVTSALDARTERIVLERISALPDKTCIAVTHRPAALELANWQLMVTEESMILSKVEH